MRVTSQRRNGRAGWEGGQPQTGVSISSYLTPSCSQGFCIPNTSQWFGVAAVSIQCGPGTGAVGMAREMDMAREPGGGCPGA